MTGRARPTSLIILEAAGGCPRLVERSMADRPDTRSDGGGGGGAASGMTIAVDVVSDTI